MSDGNATDFGRIGEDGTVYLRTGDGERAIGSWFAGTPEEGLAYYALRYADLAAEVAILEHRVTTDPKSAAAGARRIADGLATAAVIGDVEALAARTQRIAEAAGAARKAEQAARAQRAAATLLRKTALAEEAERLADSKDWKATGERLRTLIEEWKAAGGLDRPTEQALWQRVAGAREQFTQRRSAHFSELDEQRRGAQIRKEKLVHEAEALATSTEWVATANRLKDLQAQWKTIGRAPREVEETLHTRFRAAADAFFAARNAALSERDEQFRGNQKTKEALLVEAEGLARSVADGGDAAAAARRLREIQERWEAAGKVPRDVLSSLERRLEAVETTLRGAAEARWRSPRVEASPLVIRLRESVAKLETRRDRARAAGREADAVAAEEALATQRAWLAQAQSG